VNLQYVDGDRHASIVGENRERVTQAA